MTPTTRAERPGVYRVLMSDMLFDHLGAGSVDWGEPDTEGFYTPTVHTSAHLARAQAEARQQERERWAPVVRALVNALGFHNRTPGGAIRRGYCLPGCVACGAIEVGLSILRETEA